jgi:predicted ATPase
MGRDQITKITIEGLRSIARLTLPLRGLTVLIGENGAGKSTIVEACELLRRAAGPQFLQELNSIHGGVFNLFRDGAKELRLGARVEGGAGPPLRYEVCVASTAMGHAQIVAEVLEVDAPDAGAPDRRIERRNGTAKVHLGGQVVDVKPPADQVVLGWSMFSPHDDIFRMRAALASVEVYLPFEVLPFWASRAHDRASTMRAPALLQPTRRLGTFGENLANAYYTLRNELGEVHWQTTMEYVRLGLGDQIESINTRADPGGGAIALWLKLKNRDRQLPASVLADGTLAYLALVAMYRLEGERALLVSDEPDLHLHPALLSRVVGFFESMAEERPVLLTTHSDRLLDVLQDPVSAVRVCELPDLDAGTRVRALDSASLAAWLESYRGVGELRSAGYLSSVIESPEPG